MMRTWLAALLFMTTNVIAQPCVTTSITAPSPFLGNHGEVFRVSDGSMYRVNHSYEYLYEYYPTVTLCADQGKLLIRGKTISIVPVRSSSRPPAVRLPSTQASVAPIQVVYRVRSCDYFVADGPRGYYVLEWYGGYDPERGDGIFSEIGG
jgi:hypothetical protein